MYVREWMTRAPVTVTPDSSVFDAKRIFNDHGFRHLPVVEDGELVGVVTQSDLLGASLFVAQTLFEPGSYLAELRKAKVSAFMSNPVVTVNPSDTIVHAATLLRDQKIGCLPVVEDLELVGILTETDVFDVLVNALGLREGEEAKILKVRPGEPEDTAQEVADWLRSRGLTLVSLLSYEPRGDQEETHVLVKARATSSAFVS